MIKLTHILLILFSISTFSQSKKKTLINKDTDEVVNISLDSLSKVYKKRVVYYEVSKLFDGRKIIKIKYYDKNKNLKEQIFTDTPVK